jgi:hypothetical protein
MNTQTPKRGRPATGTAMTPAQRKAAQRERALEQVAICEDLTTVSTTMLCELLPIAVNQGRVYLARDITDELLARAKQQSALFNPQ